MARAILFQPSSLCQPLFSIRAKFLNNSRQFHQLYSNSNLSSLKYTKKPQLIHISAQAKRAFSSSKKDEIASPSDLQFTSPLKIIEYPDPILRAPNKKIGEFDENLKRLVNEMFDIMYKTDGIGLAAPQVGINVRLMVFNPAGERGVGEEIVLVNPRISKFSRKLVLFEEGCLSFPEIYADVERPESVKVDAQDITGAKFSATLSALPARVFQHEFDHLQGTLFFDRMTEEVVDSIRAELQALEKKYEDANGIPSPEKVDSSIGRREVAGFGRS
ncbi:peptide deformylase [Ranunculus cassubicifolius]